MFITKRFFLLVFLLLFVVTSIPTISAAADMQRKVGCSGGHNGPFHFTNFFFRNYNDNESIIIDSFSLYDKNGNLIIDSFSLYDKNGNLIIEKEEGILYTLKPHETLKVRTNEILPDPTENLGPVQAVIKYSYNGETTYPLEASMVINTRDEEGKDLARHSSMCTQLGMPMIVK